MHEADERVTVLQMTSASLEQQLVTGLDADAGQDTSQHLKKILYLTQLLPKLYYFYGLNIHWLDITPSISNR